MQPRRSDKKGVSLFSNYLEIILTQQSLADREDVLPYPTRSPSPESETDEHHSQTPRRDRYSSSKSNKLRNTPNNQRTTLQRVAEAAVFAAGAFTAYRSITHRKAGASERERERDREYNTVSSGIETDSEFESMISNSSYDSDEDWSDSSDEMDIQAGRKEGRKKTATSNWVSDTNTQAAQKGDRTSTPKPVPDTATRARRKEDRTKTVTSDSDTRPRRKSDRISTSKPVPKAETQVRLTENRKKKATSD